MRLSDQIAVARAQLARVERSTLFKMEAHSNARADLNEDLAWEETFWRQKSRVAWLKDGDRATKFFMVSTVTRRRQSYIQSLKDETGNMVEQIEDIAQMFINKFSKIFLVHTSRNSMNLEEWSHNRIDFQLGENLNSMPNEEEVFKALC